MGCRPGSSHAAASIAAFASEFGGTEFDLDGELEAAGIESLLAIDEAPQ